MHVGGGTDWRWAGALIFLILLLSCWMASRSSDRPSLESAGHDAFLFSVRASTSRKGLWPAPDRCRGLLSGGMAWRGLWWAWPGRRDLGLWRNHFACPRVVVVRRGARVWKAEALIPMNRYQSLGWRMRSDGHVSRLEEQHVAESGRDGWVASCALD